MSNKAYQKSSFPLPAHEEYELKVREADPECREPLEYVQIPLERQPEAGQDQDGELDQVLELSEVLSEAQGVELHELLDEEKNDADQ